MSIGRSGGSTVMAVSCLRCGQWQLEQPCGVSVIDLVADGLELAGRFADVFHPKTSPDFLDSAGLPSKCLINVTVLT